MSTSSAPSSLARRSGWVTFAGVLFLLVGVFNLLDGFVALFHDDFFAGELLFGGLTGWGVWWLVIGTVQALTGAALLTRRVMGWVFGVGIASINAFTQLLWVSVYPSWAVVVIVVDGLIVWALTTHIDEFE